ncbi:MAG: peptidylprolyl isomerase FKBP-type [Streptosporangiaceae bacterium]|jgi:FKBP-type peptidyl-prolyl cis-trans isomerase|nr:peptidylprolyl isomerase FKBP-type [Streptosporangiaceae bacterium]
MRRRLAVVSAAGMLAAVMPLAASCGAGDVPVKVTGPFGTRPDVTFPGSKPGDSLAISTPVEGKGPQIAKKDLVIANYVGYRWSQSGSKMISTSYGGDGRPSAFPAGKLVPGLDKALVGSKVGSRVVAVIPPKQGYGDTGNTQLQVGPRDSLVFVLDVVGTYPKTAAAKGRALPQDDAGLPQVGASGPGQAPPVRMPGTHAPAKLQVRALIQGSGQPVRSGQLLALNYAGLFWRDGRVFDSSWSSGQAFATAIGKGQVVKGWDDGLVGQRVGSRVLLVVPPAWGYGPKGLKQAGIKGTDTLVFVVDILGAH